LQGTHPENGKRVFGTILLEVPGVEPGLNKDLSPAEIAELEELLTASYYALQSIIHVMCSSGLCSAKLSNLYNDLAHQLSPDFARLLDFT